MSAPINPTAIKGLTVVIMLTLALGSCTDANPGGAGESLPPSSTSVVTTVSTTSSPPQTTVPTTTIPTTSIPPPTVAPPDLTPTTTTVLTSETTVPDQILDGTIVVAPEDDLPQLVTQAAPGTSFLLLPGVHRSGRVTPKDDMTFEGLEGTILNGSVLLDGFADLSGSWETTEVELSTSTHGVCVDGYEACALRNDLFMDDQMLWRVDNRDEVIAGTWWSDGRTIVVVDNPIGRKVEVSINQHAFRSDADGVTIRNLVVEKYATQAQSGAIQAQLPGEGSCGNNWLIENVEARLNHAAGIRAGDNTTIRDVHAHHNGQQGITGGAGTGVLVESSEIDHNNIRGFSRGWEAGGAKFTRTEGLVLRDLNVHHNFGPGLWTDIDCHDTTYVNNVIYSNTGPGIFHEISYNAVIHGNEIYDNGFGKGEWVWGAGILIVGSTDVEVFDNVVTNNADGIAGIQQDRSGDDGLWKLENLYVHDNTITMWYGQSGVVQDMSDTSVFTNRGIVFANNKYIGAGHEAFEWDNTDKTWDEWIATGQGTGSTRSDG